MKSKFINYFMDIAERTALLSSAERLKVGAILVKEDRIISIGYNGMPSGWSNVCEVDDTTKKEVLHAEANCISKMAKCPESSEGATLFCTHLPCLECAKLIHQAGIKEVIYKHVYESKNNGSGLSFMISCGIIVIRW